MTTPRPPIPTAPKAVKVASLVSAFLADGKLHVTRYIKAFPSKIDPEKANSDQIDPSKTGVLGYCGVTSSEADGIYHVPNWAFDGRAEHGDVVVCPMCSMTMTGLAEPV